MATKRKAKRTSSVQKFRLTVELGVNKNTGNLTAGAARITKGAVAKKKATRKRVPANSGIAGPKRRKTTRRRRRAA